VTNGINRRLIIQGSGAAVVAPFIPRFLGKSVLAQATSAASVPQFSHRLHQHVTTGLSRTIKKLNEHTAQPGDLRESAYLLEAHAAHMDSLKLNGVLGRVLRNSADQQLQSVNDIPTPIADRMRKRFAEQGVQSSLDILTPCFQVAPGSPQEHKRILRGCLKYGYSGVLRVQSQGLRYMAVNLQQAINNGQWPTQVGYRKDTQHSQVVPATYAPGAAHLEHICVVSPKQCAVWSGVIAGGMKGAKTMLSKGLKLAEQAIEAELQGEGSAAAAAYSEALAGASSSEIAAAGALEALADLASCGPEAILFGVGIAAIAFGLLAAYCATK
jgi:hypothetical protein